MVEIASVEVRAVLRTPAKKMLNRLGDSDKDEKRVTTTTLLLLLSTLEDLPAPSHYHNSKFLHLPLRTLTHITSIYTSVH